MIKFEVGEIYKYMVDRNVPLTVKCTKRSKNRIWFDFIGKYDVRNDPLFNENDGCRIIIWMGSCECAIDYWGHGLFADDVV